MAAIEVDTRRPHLVISRFPERWDDDEVKQYFQTFRDIHAKGERFAHVVDISRASAMSNAGMRKRAAEFIMEQEALSAKLCIGTANYAPSAVVRGALTAIHWMSPPPYPYVIVGDLTEGMRWIEARLLEAGLSSPAASAG